MFASRDDKKCSAHYCFQNRTMKVCKQSLLAHLNGILGNHSIVIQNMKMLTGESQGSGFLNFGTEQERDTAVSILHGIRYKTNVFSCHKFSAQKSGHKLFSEVHRLGYKYKDRIILVPVYIQNTTEIVCQPAKWKAESQTLHAQLQSIDLRPACCYPGKNFPNNL